MSALPVGYDSGTGLSTELKLVLGSHVSLPDPKHPNERDLERWHAQLVLVTSDDDGRELSSEPVATTRAVRAHGVTDGNQWVFDFDDNTADLSAIATDLYYNGEEGMFDQLMGERRNLLAVEYVEVVEKYRGEKLSHQLIAAVARVFSDCVIALVPAQRTEQPDGTWAPDPVKYEALARHWQQGGFELFAQNTYTLTHSN